MLHGHITGGRWWVSQADAGWMQGGLMHRHFAQTHSLRVANPYHCSYPPSPHIMCTHQCMLAPSVTMGPIILSCEGEGVKEGVWRGNRGLICRHCVLTRQPL